MHLFIGKVIKIETESKSKNQIWFHRLLLFIFFVDVDSDQSCSVPDNWYTLIVHTGTGSGSQIVNCETEFSLENELSMVRPGLLCCFHLLDLLDGWTVWCRFSNWSSCCKSVSKDVGKPGVEGGIDGEAWPLTLSRKTLSLLRKALRLKRDARFGTRISF